MERFVKDDDDDDGDSDSKSSRPDTTIALS
jgi:hypothetical protein